MAEPSAAEHTAEDVELLATKLMGWTHVGSSEADMWWDSAAGHAWHGDATKALRESREFLLHPYHWCPFTDANHDVQVLERVREVWPPRKAGDFSFTSRDEFRAWLNLADEYRCGDYARAALVVLREMEEG